MENIIIHKSIKNHDLAYFQAVDNHHKENHQMCINLPFDSLPYDGYLQLYQSCHKNLNVVAMRNHGKPH